MKSMIIACDTLSDELSLAQKKVGSNLETMLIEGNLHNYPEKLKDTLQQELNAKNGYDRILLGFGFCGNSIVGLRTLDFEIIVPRIDDCVSILLGSEKRHTELLKTDRSFFITDGWLRHDPNICDEYDDTVEKYGEDTGAVIMQGMYANYNSFSIIDTEAYNIEPVKQRVKPMADNLGFKCSVVSGTVSYLERLITGPWDDEMFLRVPANSQILAKQLRP